MSGETCSGCKHFMQHYCLGDKKLFRVNCGHCTAMSPRRRRPGTKACERFLPGQVDTEAFAAKGYLSKALLQHLLRLELLPETEVLPGRRKKEKT